MFGGEYPMKDILLNLDKSGGIKECKARKSLIIFDSHEYSNSLKKKGNIIYASSLYDSCKKCNIAVKGSNWKSFYNFHKN